MNVIGPIFAVVCILLLLYFGLGTTQTMMDDATGNVANSTELSDSLNTSKELTAPTFSIMTTLVWFMVLIALIGVLYLIMKLV